MTSSAINIKDVQLRTTQKKIKENEIYAAYHAAKKRSKQIREELDIEEEILQARKELLKNVIQHLRPRPSELEPCPQKRLPEKLDDFVEYIVDVTGWRRIPVILFTLAALSIAMCGRYRVKLNEHWSEAVVLYMFLCAPSENRKSTLLEMLKRPHINYENFLQKQYTLEQHKEAAARTIQRDYTKKVQQKIIKENIEKFNINTPEELHTLLNKVKNDTMYIENCYENIHNQRFSIPRFFINESSPHILYKTIYEQYGGINIFEAEGNNLLSIINTPKSKLEIFTKAFSFENAVYDTKKDGSLMIDKPFINIAIIANSNVIRQLYANERAWRYGLTPCAMVYFDDHIPLPHIENRQHEEIYQFYCKKITVMLKRNYTQKHFRDIYDCILSKNAYAILKKFEFEGYDRYSQETHDAQIFAFLRNRHTLAVRLAAVLHAWQYDEPEREQISAENIEIAIEILRYIEPDIKYAFSPSGIQAYYDAQKIIDWIKHHHHQYFTNKDIAQGIANMRNANIFPALDMLEQHKVIKQIIRHDKRIWVVHPRACRQ